MTNVLKRHRDRRRKQAERARARAKRFFGQLIKITVSATSGVDSPVTPTKCVIQFKNLPAIIDLIDYRQPD